MIGKILVIGGPNTAGGAGRRCWDTVRLWRLRIQTALQARRDLGETLARPAAVWNRWRRLLRGMTARKPRALPAAPRVGFIAPCLDSGGAERWMISLARHARRLRWVGTACLDARWVDSHVLAEMADYMPVFLPGARGHPINGVCRMRSAEQAVQTVLNAADVVLAWGTQRLPELLRDWPGAVVVVSHGAKDEWTRRIVRDGHRVATHFAAVSRAALEPFAGIVPVEQVRVIPNGVEAARCLPTRNRKQIRTALGYTEQDIVVGYLGRLGAEKRPHLLARAVAKLPACYRALYVGHGGEEARVRAEAEALLGPRVRFLPPMPLVGDVLAAMDVFFLSSPSEGCGLAILEAMLAGVPVVATPVGVLPEIGRCHGEVWWPIPIEATDEQNAAAIRLAAEDTAESRHRCTLARRIVRHRHLAGHMAQAWTSYLYEVMTRGRCRAASFGGWRDLASGSDQTWPGNPN